MSANEAVAARVDELADGQMKQVTVAGTEVLLARVGGHYHAVGAFCTHYGAPLANGVLSGARVVCPWHHACFSVVSGDQEEPPGLDALPCFAVRVEGEQVIVALPEGAGKQRLPTMAAPDAADKRVFAVLGGGTAGAAAVEALRQEGYRGRILLISAEGLLPYDRTTLSKAYLAEREKQSGVKPSRDAAFYQRHGIEVQTGKEVKRVRAEARQIEFADGGILHYDALLLATGATPRRLPVPGADLPGVLTLRTPGDVDQIAAAAQEGSRVVVIGSSFIGMECASALRSRKVEVQVVAMEQVPFERVLGRKVGGLFKTVAEEAGVVFHFSAQVERVAGQGREVKVVLKGGVELAADFVVIGAGVKPATEYLDGVPKNPDGSLNVDEHLKVAGADRLFAAGDIAAFPDPLSGERIRIEHWRVAGQQGRVAARNMAGHPTPFTQVPFFWTRQFNQNLRYVGHAQSFDEVVVEGDLGQKNFLAYYVKGGQIRAVAGMGRDKALCAIEECMRLRRMPPLGAIRAGLDWEAQLRG
ncbi:MAG: FAD-dependent oxidoreductase [Candidatus Handelsmanbacteria bacterium]|nr:FAD-dependent oxidoreductase [Candidatus Handelsmanbacteria bacterium]